MITMKRNLDDVDTAERKERLASADNSGGILMLPSRKDQHAGCDQQTTAPEAEDGASGDIIYGGRAIADFIFPEEPKRDRARRRVFNLAAYHFARKEKAGFFKLKGALCLSKKQWRRFHGLG
jgi:hypothetical protein